MFLYFKIDLELREGKVVTYLTMKKTSKERSKIFFTTVS